jgi:hypothetical protein
MPNQYAIWQVADRPAILPAANPASEQLLESMIVRELRTLSGESMLIGHQEVSSHGGSIDPLATASEDYLDSLKHMRGRTFRGLAARGRFTPALVAAV